VIRTAGFPPIAFARTRFFKGVRRGPKGPDATFRGGDDAAGSHAFRTRQTSPTPAQSGDWNLALAATLAQSPVPRQRHAASSCYSKTCGVRR